MKDWPRRKKVGLVLGDKAASEGALLLFESAEASVFVPVPVPVIFTLYLSLPPILHLCQ